jgi:hypothetical protein
MPSGGSLMEVVTSAMRCCRSCGACATRIITSMLEEIVAAQAEAVRRDGVPVHAHLDGDGVYVTATQRVWAPDVQCLRLRLAVVAHQGPAAHRGVDTTLRALQQYFYWDSMASDIATFAASVPACSVPKCGAGPAGAVSLGPSATPSLRLVQGRRSDSTSPMCVRHRQLTATTTGGYSPCRTASPAMWN